MPRMQNTMKQLVTAFYYKILVYGYKVADRWAGF